MMKSCQICDQDLVIKWTDTHGFAVCDKCGCPYQVYHYDENNKRMPLDVFDYARGCGPAPEVV